MHLFPNPKTVFYSECDKVQDFLSKRSLSFDTTDGAPGAKPITHINDVDDRRLSTSPSWPRR